jgi:hypothetical protein
MEIRIRILIICLILNVFSCSETFEKIPQGSNDYRVNKAITETRKKINPSDEDIFILVATFRGNEDRNIYKIICGVKSETKKNLYLHEANVFVKLGKESSEVKLIQHFNKELTIPELKVETLKGELASYSGDKFKGVITSLTGGAVSQTDDKYYVVKTPENEFYIVNENKEGYFNVEQFIENY